MKQPVRIDIAWDVMWSEGRLVCGKQVLKEKAV